MRNDINKNDQGINVLDLLVYLISKWIWYILSIALFCGLAWYYYAKSPEVYFRSATVIIKDPSNKATSAGLDRFDNYINKVNVANELLQFQSKRIMRNVVERIHADVSYKLKVGLRDKELYNRAPVNVSFQNVMSERYITFDLTTKDEKTVVVSNVQGMLGAKDSYTLSIGKDSIAIHGEVIKVNATDFMDNTWNGTTIKVSKLPVNAIADSYRANLGIRQEEDEASILTLSLKDNSPERAEDVLNTLITVYNEDAVNDKNQVAVNTANFINERLIIIEKELNGVETELQSFKQSNNIVDLGSATSQYMGEASAYNSEAVQNETQIKVTEYVRDYLTDPSKSRDLIPSNSGIGDMEIENQITQYNNLKLKRDRLAADSSDDNPVVEELNKAMHDLRQSVVRAVDNKIVSLQVKGKDARSQRAMAQARFNAIPAKERQLLGIERQQNIKESLYLFLLNKREENALSQAMADNNARVIDSADGSYSPIAPNRNRILLLGAAVGIAVPSLFFLFTMFLDTRIHSRKDLQGEVSVPFLGEIPEDKELAKKRKKREAAVGVTEQGQGMVSEAFRILRTNMTFMAKKGQASQVITFTSFNEGAGKSFISHNLALSLIYAKKKVIIVDLDIRKGTLSRRLNQNVVGVTNYLSDTSIQIDDLIHADAKWGIDVIAAGPIAPNPAELLMDERLDELIAELRTRYDYIIADNVPVGIVADASITNRISDITLFVVRAGMLDRRQLPDLESLYKDGKLKNMAVVLNGVDPDYRGYGYRYGYGYGYGNGYGSSYVYGQGKNKRKKFQI